MYAEPCIHETLQPWPLSSTQHFPRCLWFVHFSSDYSSLPSNKLVPKPASVVSFMTSPSRMTAPFTTFPDIENHGLHHLRSFAAALCLDVALTSYVFPLESSRTSIGAFSRCSLPVRELRIENSSIVPCLLPRSRHCKGYSSLYYRHAP